MMFMTIAALFAAIAPESLASADSVGVKSASNHVSEGFESGLEVHDVSDWTLCFVS